MVVWVVKPRVVMITQGAAVNGMHRNGFQNCWRAANSTEQRNERTAGQAAGGTRPEIADCRTIIVFVTIIIIIMRYRLYDGIYNSMGYAVARLVEPEGCGFESR
jgi:hypothetical protein